MFFLNYHFFYYSRELTGGERGLILVRDVGSARKRGVPGLRLEMDGMRRDGYSAGAAFVSEQSERDLGGQGGAVLAPPHGR
ncbi:hypothetical protein Syn6312_2880 [Synechococcus sp. PCC 6312]|nr:hypothetical protein Syn6312_2880 [Synechococcus sp. PCC 6312]